MDSRDRELRFFKRYALVSSTAALVLALAAFRQAAQTQAAQKQKFTEIDVERINVVEPDGKLRLVIANRPRSIGPIYKGKPFGYPGGSRPGIIFFNDEGTENGGFTLAGKRGADGRYEANTHLSFDQFDQDQVMVLDYADDGTQRRVGLSFADRTQKPIIDFVAEYDSVTRMSDGPAKAQAMRRLQQPVRDGEVMHAQRLFVGRDADRSAVLRLSDPMGRPRVRLLVDSLGAGRLEFLDDSGRVTARLPEARR